MKIVFMGTPEFAVPSLRALQQSRHQVVAVVTGVDKPVGRGLKVRHSPVKQVALELGLPILQPEDLRAPEFVAQLEPFQADLFVVVAFRILPPSVFTLPPKGTVNLHASLLPRYRGAAPINWAIINGETETGVTTFFIQEQVDTGDLILQERVPIGPDETAGELHDRLAEIGAQLVVKTVELIAAGEVQPQPQVGEATRAPKLTKELTRVDWSKPSTEIRNLIRGLAPTPGARTVLQGRLVKLFRAQAREDAGATEAPGTVVAADARAGLLEVATGRGTLQIQELQPEGKRRLSAAEFLRGYPVKIGERFE